ncbi:MAG: transcriptional repressor [Bacteroidetes bacterium]|nr:MAG: transcriptional repressor [Bacteroidota bacterium]
MIIVMKTIQEIAKSISESGLKVTPQRVAVMQAFEKLNHPRAEEIYKEVYNSIPGLSPTTVYNILDVLVNKGIVKRVKTESGVMRYDAVSDHHHHMYCLSSDRVEDFFDPELDKILQEYFEKKRIDGFKIEDIKLQLMGKFE